MKLNIVSDPFSTTGYGIHCKNLALALSRKDIDISIETPVPQNALLNYSQELVELCNKRFTHDPTLMITLPPVWKVKSGEKIKPYIGYGVFEGTRVPLDWAWAAQDENVTEVWYPSKHSLNAFKTAGVKEEKMKVIPHGVDTNTFNPQVPPHANFARLDGFKFLFVGGWKDGVRDRKGLDVLIKAFCAEFKKGEKASLTAKINLAYGGDPRQIMDEIEKLGLPPKNERPALMLVFEQLPEKQLASVYAAHDCFVMPTKAEGFCMPCAEAMATGLPVITTDYGGQAEYVNESQKGQGLIKVEKMVQATGEPTYFYEQAEWAQPDQEDLRKWMRIAFDNRGGWREMGGENSKFVENNLTWRHAANKAASRLEELTGFVLD